VTILNETLDWSAFAATPSLRDSFRGTPAKTLLPAGRCLSRFITCESKKKNIHGNEIFLSPWWTNWNDTWTMLAKWKAFKVAPKQTIRAKLAVTSAMNVELDSLVQIILTSPVYAWQGPARHQEDKTAGITYLGGGTQLFLPNLAVDASGSSSPVAYIHCFTSIDTLTDA
jgi:hypothetical protein